MTELFACVGLFLGLCGHHIIERYDTEQQCLAVLAELQKNQSVSYAYCRKPRDTEKKK